MIDNLYDMEHLWNSGGKAWKYEYNIVEIGNQTET